MQPHPCINEFNRLHMDYQHIKYLYLNLLPMKKAPSFPAGLPNITQSDSWPGFLSPPSNCQLSIINCQLINQLHPPCVPQFKHL